MRDLVNFVLRSTGCALKITEHDIIDVDNAPSKLQDLQDEYQAQNVTEYPLISRLKSHSAFRAGLVGFFDSLIKTIHASSILYKDVALFENLQIWVTTMTSSGVRPFRHTATVISLAIVSAFCDVAKEIKDSVARSTRQFEGEKKKNKVNKGRLASIEKGIRENEKRLETIDSIVKDVFDSVFIHRYRDVDPKIRTDCVTALGYWIQTYPDMFFEGQYLRYLGWLLSDVAPHCRAEVIKQLQKLFKNQDNLAGLRSFTERFRPRMVEMAAQDAEATVRASSIELLDAVRSAGFLEPTDIDAIGKLIFDAEPRVRKSVVGFFIENIEDLLESRIEDLGGEDAFNEAFPEDEERESHKAPSRLWLTYKCLVDVFQEYDQDEDAEQPNIVKRPTTSGRGMVTASRKESRFTLATQALYGRMPDLEDWESLAGYLLYDHSQTDPSATTDDVLSGLKRECKLEENQEIVLLEILCVVVKERLIRTVESDADKKGHRSKARKQEIESLQDDVARSLAQIVPQLLKKFGALPDAASAVLRLVHVLNLDIFQELRQESTTFAQLLEDINKQFMTHADEGVLAEAGAALLHAKSYEELQEVTEGKIQLLWEDNIATLMALTDSKDLQALAQRGNLTLTALEELSNTVRRISNLASISDCIEALTVEPVDSQSAGKTPMIILLALLHRGNPDEEPDFATDSLEDELAANALRTILFYFMWRIRAIKAEFSAEASQDAELDLEDLTEYREALFPPLKNIMQNRRSSQSLRLTAANALIDSHTLFATLPHSATTDSQKDLASQIVQKVPEDLQTVLAEILNSTEKTYAKRSNRAGVVIDVDEEDPDAPVSEDSDDEDENEEDPEAALRAEQTLCELAGKLTLASVAGVIGAELRERLIRNKGKLGPNFKGVVGFLDEPRAPSKKASAKPKPKNVKSSERVLEIEDDPIEDEQMEEDGEEDLRANGLVEDDVQDPDPVVAGDDDGAAGGSGGEESILGD